MLEKDIREALIELQNASRRIVTEDDFRTTIKKYDMVFMGEKINVINSLELAHSLKNVFDLPVEHDYLLTVLPRISDSLGIRLEGMVQSQDLSELAAYHITLY